MNANITTVVLSATVIGGLIAPAHAWRSSWGARGSDSVTMRAHVDSFPSGGSRRDALTTVIDRLNDNPSEFRYEQRWDDTNVNITNSQDEVWFGTNVAPLAATYARFNWYTRNLATTDVVFYDARMTTDGWGWETSDMDKAALTSYYDQDRDGWRDDADRDGLPDDGKYPFQCAAIHEYGHVAGLDHVDDEYNVMGWAPTHVQLNGQTVRAYLGEDASDGLVDFYGRNSSERVEDVSVTHFEYVSVRGDYSTHGKCGITAPSVPVTMEWDSTELMYRYNVTPGGSVTFDLYFRDEPVVDRF